MANRIISLIIFLWIIFGIWYAFFYFFIENKWNLTLNSNVWDYKVEVYTDKLKTTFSSQCKNTKCELIDLAPFDYTLTIKKDWYKDFSTNIKVISKNTIELDVELEKQISIKKLPEIKKEINNEEKLEKFRELSFLQKSYKYFDVESLGVFYFIDNKDNTLTLYKKNSNPDDTKLFSINIKNDTELFLDKVYQTENEIIISYWDDKYIFNLDLWKETKIFFPQNINYVKKSQLSYFFINDKWTFIYDINTWKTEYFYMFRDFLVYDENNYFWIIYKDEVQKLDIYNLTDYKDTNLIIKYNFKNKNIKVLESVSQNITKIVNENNKIYFYDENQKYLVNNID